MRIEDVIGQRITRAREDAGLTQAQVGEELGRYLGRPWPRQAVSAAEKGRRSFTAAELVALAFVLGRNVESLLVPPTDVPSVSLADGAPIDTRHLRGSDQVKSDTDLRQLIQTLIHLRREASALLGSAQQLDDMLDNAAMEAWSAARGRGVEVDNNLLGLPPRKTEQ